MQKEHTFTVDVLINGGRGLYPGGLIPGIIYSFENGLAYTQGGLKVGFYGISSVLCAFHLIVTNLMKLKLN